MRRDVGAWTPAFIVGVICLMAPGASAQAPRRLCEPWSILRDARARPIWQEEPADHVRCQPTS